MTDKMWFAHVVAAITIFIWGITFISTKILLADFSPQEILFTRFFLGWLALWAICPARVAWQGCGNETSFALAGFFGVTLYFLLENIALEYTLAANASVIVSTAPFFTALVEWLFFNGSRPSNWFYIGFVLALGGIAMISFQNTVLHFNPLGDTLALLAAIAWAFYSGFIKKLSGLGLGTLKTTRRVFFYGLAFMLPVFAFTGWHAPLSALTNPVNLFNLLFLGIVASALCFVFWTFCLVRLGVDKASAYIYLVPVVTIITAAIILQERFTLISLLGMFLVILGLFLSEMPFGKTMSAQGKQDNQHQDTRLTS